MHMSNFKDRWQQLKEYRDNLKKHESRNKDSIRNQSNTQKDNKN